MLRCIQLADTVRHASCEHTTDRGRKMIDWNSVTKEDSELLNAITNRALKAGFGPDKTGLSMDITAAHISNPLDLQKLLDAPDATFGHDVGGIQAHLNRTTGKLGGCFDPRCSKPQ